MTKRTILITGASTGIGHHAAHALAKRGWHVVAAARKARDIARLKEEGLDVVRLDYALEPTITSALEDIETQHLRAQFEANFFGWHTLTRAVLPVMRKQGSGRIVQCSSVLGFIGAPYRGPYAASKFAVEGYSDVLRAEVAPFGIKVVSIQPGPITSQFRATALSTFERTVQVEGSAYADDYTHQMERMRSADKASFELGPQAVTKALITAVESANPKPAYRVTTPTHMMALAKRVLPGRALHAMLAKATRK